MKLEDVSINDLGTSKKIIVAKDSTTIIGGNGDKKRLQEHIDKLEAQLKETTSKNEYEQIAKRLAKLSNGVALIKVGATTESELKEKKLRIEDALSATKAAVEEGIVAGGGTAYVNVIPKVAKLLETTSGDEKTGVSIVLKALEEPVRQIATNAGLEGSVILDKVKASPVGVGFDALKEEYVDMKKNGIVDPTKVTRSALQNAASIATMVLTTEAAVADKPEKECDCGHGAPGMGAGMGMY